MICRDFFLRRSRSARSSSVDSLGRVKRRGTKGRSRSRSGSRSRSPARGNSRSGSRHAPSRSSKASRSVSRHRRSRSRSRESKKRRRESGGSSKSRSRKSASPHSTKSSSPEAQKVLPKPVFTRLPYFQKPMKVVQPILPKREVSIVGIRWLYLSKDIGFVIL